MKFCEQLSYRVATRQNCLTAWGHIEHCASTRIALEGRMHPNQNFPIVPQPIETVF
jgi:hypothetical protein